MFDHIFSFLFISLCMDSSCLAGIVSAKKHNNPINLRNKANLLTTPSFYEELLSQEKKMQEETQKALIRVAQ